jgi:hypothetical protein
MYSSDMFVTAKFTNDGLPETSFSSGNEEVIVFSFSTTVDADVYDCASWGWNSNTHERHKFYFDHGGVDVHTVAKTYQSKVIQEVRDMKPGLSSRHRRDYVMHEVREERTSNEDLGAAC